MQIIQLRKTISTLILLLLIVLLFSFSTWQSTDPSESIRIYSREYEFDYLGWELNAIWNKLLSSSLGSVNYLRETQQNRIIERYFQLLSNSNILQRKVSENYSDPQTSSLVEDTQQLESKLEIISHLLTYQKRLAESVLQHQIGNSLRSLNLATMGTPFPPILFQTTKLPLQLIISPRNIIRQENSISLFTDITLSEITDLEKIIEKNTNYSALVVPIGGVGTYPTMIINSPYIENQIETIAHEWIHNFLVFRPLGFRYDSSSALRTMNETTASIAGLEISQAVIRLFYPDLMDLSPIQPRVFLTSINQSNENNLEVFNFSREMYLTRIEVDEMLAKGQITEAEQYMELRRLFFWENGYQIRKLNQAYFAFHGAYADTPYSAAGRDPVGDNVRLFRARQPSLAAFVKKISKMRSYSELRIAARSY